ncbi:MucBP domain-containing protein [Paenibacillus macerans]|uniref:MucBP domain-containing protein n=1 Tax=Paenibacillus macerans TaxID=44252 RepID=UPI001BCD17C1|nr:MucBP domain-containing protein [Paenibacillus macerans]
MSKTAQPTGSPGEWEITLKAEGKNVRTSSDIVLVIDKSGSMDQRSGWFTPSKMDNAKDAAKKFVDNLLLPNSSTQIAVVSFNKSSTLISGFKGAGNKNALKNAIEGIEPTGGTNIQAGLKKASDLLANSIAQNKIIVLLSDGEPTFSFKGTHAEGFNWPNSSNNFSITSFDYGKTLGTGADFTFKNYDCNIFGFNCKNDTYNINNYQVKDNGIGTISEAKIAKDAGLKIFSVGLEVSNNSNAINVLKDIQSEGYFPANSDELNTIFREMAGKISYAAQNAKVVDPMGDMFNLKKQGAQVSPQDYSASQGTVTWNAATETFTWDVGNIAEGEPASLTYKVVLDQSKNPVSNVLYPTNGKTTIEYTNVTGEKVSKDFEVPKVSIGNGSILMKGYKVNASGKPVNAEGVEVEGPEFAELLYSEYYKDQNGNEALPIGAAEYSVSAKNIAGYQLKVGENPVSIRLTATNPTPTVWFGYEEAVERTVTVHYLEQGTEKELAQSTTVKGVAGQKVTLTAVEIPGYTPENKTAEYVVKAEGSNEYTFYYVANKQSVEVQYLEQGTNKKLADPTTVEGVTGQTLELKAIGIPGYTPVEPSFNYKLGVENAPHIFYYTPSEQTVTVKFVEKELGNELIEPRTVTGHTGKTVTLEAAEIPGYTPENKTAEYVVKAEGSNEYTFYYVAHKQSVEVQYLEQGTNKKLADPTTVEGVTGQTLELKAIGIPGYTPVKSSSSYKLGVENPPYVFYYTASEQTVTVKFVEKELGNELIEPRTVTGHTGKTVTLEAAEIPGYTPENKTAEYVVKAGSNEYTFYYVAHKQSVEVQYLEQGTNKKLADPTTVEGVTGQTLELKAIGIPGYTPVEPSFNYELGVENAPHIFYYTANATEPDDSRTLTVRYVDQQTGKDLLNPTERSGKVGEKITLTAENYTDTVTGAVYKPHAYEVPYTFTEDQVQQFVFKYAQGNTGQERIVTIHHVDRETDEELIEPTASKGIAGTNLVFYPEPISVTDVVYFPEQTKYDIKITLDAGQEYTIYYVKGEPDELAQVTVSYRDRETGNELAAQEIYKGRIGAGIEFSAKQVEGYTPEVANHTHTWTDDPNQTYVFYYTKNAPADRQLTVKYLENGTNRQLASQTTVSGKPGETKTLTAVSVSGYNPVKATASYTFSDQEGQEYAFYYTKKSSDSSGSSGSDNSGSSNPNPSPSTPEVDPLPPLPPLPAVPPKLETENHYDYINGYPDGTVKPLNNITREEVAAIFYRLLDDESRSAYLKTGNSFSDVGNTRWSNKHISTMENAGIITGYPDGIFKPGQYITRAEFAAIASRFDKLDERQNDTFTDITGHWAEKYIASAANKGWIKGYTDGTFKPDQYITRAEAAKFINSVLNRKVDKDGIHKDTKQWPDNISSMWYYYDILEATNHHEYSRSESGVEVWSEIKASRVYP